MARGKKVLITATEFCVFRRTVEELHMQGKFVGATLYHDAIYLEESHSYISWSKHTSLATLKKILIGINAMFNTNFSLVEEI